MSKGFFITFSKKININKTLQEVQRDLSYQMQKDENLKCFINEKSQ